MDASGDELLPLAQYFHAGVHVVDLINTGSDFLLEFRTAKQHQELWCLADPLRCAAQFFLDQLFQIVGAERVQHIDIDGDQIMPAAQQDADVFVTVQCVIECRAWSGCPGLQYRLLADHRGYIVALIDQPRPERFIQCGSHAYPRIR